MAKKKLPKATKKTRYVSGKDKSEGGNLTEGVSKKKLSKKKKVSARGEKRILVKTISKISRKPKKVKVSGAAKGCLEHLDIILNGTFISCDPSSGGGSGANKSNPYFCKWVRGIPVNTWGVEIKSGWSKYKRIRFLADAMREMEIETDLLVIEDVGVIRAGGFSSVNKSLIWSVGTIIAGLSPENVIEVSPMSWQALTDKKTYIKSDRNDAVAIGHYAVQTAKGDRDKLPEGYLN